MEKEGFVSVWAVCGFTEDELEEYTEYDYENECPSRFCVENGINEDEIDEDFIEKAVYDRIFIDAAELLADCSYSGNFVSTFAGRKLPENCNGMIIVYDYEHIGITAENPDVVFLGTAVYKKL